MSAQDRELLGKAGLSIKRAAELLDRSRQTVSNGVRGDRDYFRPNDLIRLNAAVAHQLPDKQARLRGAITDLFDDLAERLGAPTSSRNAIAAIAEASRLWLIFPSFVDSRAEQPAAYENVFSAIGARSAASLEVIAFCDRERVEIESLFAQEWFDRKQLAVIECDVVSVLTPMIVVDPHHDDRRSCFALTAEGFQALAPGQTAERVKAFGAHISGKIREARAGHAPINARTASAEQLLELGPEKL